MMLEGFELLYAYLDQNTIRWIDPDESVYNSIRFVEKELARTKRALWLARADRAHWVSENADAYKAYCDKHPSSHYLKYDGRIHFYEWGRKWENAELKCRSYAEKFNEE